MSMNVPLGVRFFHMKKNIDVHITKYVEDFSFRHTAPGGCASCTIKLRDPKENSTMNPEDWGMLYSRIQIFDTRSAEVIWEGRVEDPAVETDEGWELGVLGAAVAATDVSIPMIYIDNTLEHWVPFDADAFDHSKDDATKTLITRMVEGFVYDVGSEYYVWLYTGADTAGFVIGRIGTTYDGSGPNPAADDLFDMLLSLSNGANVDITAFNAAPIYKSNIIPTDLVTTDLSNSADYKIRRRTSNYTITSGDVAVARFIRPVVQAMRINRSCENYILASDYNHGDFVYPWHVVEDCIGRFMNGGWDQGTSLDLSFVEDLPEKGLVNGNDCFVNTSSTKRIVNLQYPDGVDAKTILDTMMTVQPEAYWALWPSKHLDKTSAVVGTDDFAFDHKFRFEWALWPEAPNYFVSTKDGMQSQKDGESLYNRLSMKVTYNPGMSPGQVVTHTSQTYGSRFWDVDELENEFTRGIVIKRESPIGEFDDSLHIAMDEAEKTRYVRDTGTITIKRPVFYFDSGESSGWGFSGMVDPWEIRPGKLMRITDIHPESDAGTVVLDMGSRFTLNFNPDFETGPGTPGWYSHNGTATRVSDFKTGGGFAGKHTPSGAGPDSFMYTDWQTMLPDEWYGVRGWIRCAVTRTVFVQIHFYSASDVFISSASKSYALTANTWTYVEMSAMAPYQTAKGPMLITMTGTPPISNAFWIDDMRFESLDGLPYGHRNAVFRMAATVYNTSDNSCTVELDQLPKWSVATQIANPGSAGTIVTL